MKECDADDFNNVGALFTNIKGPKNDFEVEITIGRREKSSYVIFFRQICRKEKQGRRLPKLS